MVSRGGHEVVSAYVSTDTDLTSIIRNSHAPDSPLLQAVSSLQESLAGRRLARDAIMSANSVQVEGSDADVLLIMLTSWADLSLRITRPAQSEALVQRARSLVTQDTPPEIRAMLLTSEALLADANGNKLHCETCLREAVKIVPSSSPRRKFSVWQLAIFLAQQGRGTESESDLQQLQSQCNENFPPERIACVKFINAVETGNTRVAAGTVEEARKSSDAMGPANRTLFRLYEALLGIMRGRADRSDVPPVPFKFPSDMPFPAKASHALLMRDTAESLRLARLDANRMTGSIFASGFTSFNMVRSELAAGNAEAARRLIELRRLHGNEHYLDDLFSSRVLLLNGDRDEARRTFLRSMKSCDYYGARGRLNFELMMACELSPIDLVEISNNPEQAHRQREPAKLKHTRPNLTATPPAGSNPLIGASQAMLTVGELMDRIAATDASVLITGETGTGKELVARCLHAKSPRADAPFIPVNCGAIAESLLESEIFGYERGAFTGADKSTKGLFEEAGNGTIFLDEIGEISPRLQVALLRVLESGEIRPVGSARPKTTRCRVVMATNANIDQLAEKGLFRKDLLFRLQRLLITIPPLRERREDIVPLARHFLDLGRKKGIHATLSDDVVTAITSYDWPGNVRELRNVIERMRLMHSDKLHYSIEDMDMKFQPVAAVDPEIDETSDTAPETPSARNDPADGEETIVEPAQSTPSTDAIPLVRTQFRRLDTIRKLFIARKTLTRSEVMSAMGVSANTATKDLKALADEGFIQQVDPSKSTRSRYFTVRTNPPTTPPSTSGSGLADR